MGWSTLALGLLMPKGKVVAMDMAPDPAMRDGLALTNRIATRHGLPVRAVQGTSLQDVAAVVDAELGGSLDFAFIDGLHTNDQVVRQAAWDHRHRHLARWRRSIKKRVNRVRELS